MGVKQPSKVFNARIKRECVDLSTLSIVGVWRGDIYMSADGGQRLKVTREGARRRPQYIYNPRWKLLIHVKICHIIVLRVVIRSPHRILFSCHSTLLYSFSYFQVIKYIFRRYLNDIFGLVSQKCFRPVIVCVSITQACEVALQQNILGRALNGMLSLLYKIALTILSSSRSEL